ncbi:hypothetical protein FGU65_02125 [Methanoculleus sp. FWC-SCC1]|uniref:Uncharacterized protein n=1 Tax=Methanoculleus frigidifontis TaxID=2584085 RepID=A0ABT8M729_9EURY|nr:hypothetical protein [Methanoculleus sp. FWC-SCC1]MDN7023704.1 hypothetical protein [Methanoculleus sp. FWC-SCC1]
MRQRHIPARGRSCPVRKGRLREPEQPDAPRPKPREEYASRQGLAALSLQLQAVVSIVICREIGVDDAIVAAYVHAVADDLRERA